MIGITRRAFLATQAAVGLAALLPAPGWWLRPRAAMAATFVLDSTQRTTLEAALRRMIPADAPGDWSAVEAGAGDYIERLLSTDLETGETGIYATGPYLPRPPFSGNEFQRLSAVKREGWKREILRLRALYADGLAELDRRAGGSFAGLPAELQDAVLLSLDLEGSDFFRALYDHTMEGVYGHPVYGGNTGFVSWIDLCYQGDVHGVRFPDGQDATPDAWNVFGGYSPAEIVEPGACPGQGPVTG